MAQFVKREKACFRAPSAFRWTALEPFIPAGLHRRAADPVGRAPSTLRQAQGSGQALRLQARCALRSGQAAWVLSSRLRRASGLSRFRRAAVAARLALAALLLAGAAGVGSPAIAQTTVWSATLTADEVTSHGVAYFGCDNTDEDQDNCSSSTVLTDDDFTYDGTTYTVAFLYWDSRNRLSLAFTAGTGSANKAALSSLVLEVDGTEFFISSADTSDEVLIWGYAPATAWTDGTTVALKLKPASTNTASDGEVETDEDAAYTFAASDFNFSDMDALESVKIVTLPGTGTGTLKLDGTAIASGDLPQTVTKTELGDDELTYEPPEDANGNDYTTFTFKVNDGDGDSAASYTMTIDVDPVPDVTQVAVTSSPRSGTTPKKYGAGEQIRFTVTFDEAVTVTDDPVLQFGLGNVGEAVDKNAAYVSGSGTTALVFAYTVQSGDRDGNGIWIEANALKLDTDGGAEDHIRDADSHDADLTHSEPGSQATHKVDGSLTPPNTAPTAADGEVEMKEDQGYAFVTSDFNFMDTDPEDVLESVKIVTLPGSGTGTLQLARTAITSGDLPQTVTKTELGDGELVYRSPEDANGEDYTTFTFKVNDGDADSAASYTMTIAVDPVPDVTGVAVTSTPTSGTTPKKYGLGETIVFTVTFDEAVTVTGDPVLNFHLANPQQMGEKNAAYVGDLRTTALVFAYTVQAGDVDSNGIWIGANPVVLDGDDYIRDSDSHDADLMHSAEGTQSGHRVDHSLTPPGCALGSSFYSGCLTVAKHSTDDVFGYVGSYGSLSATTFSDAGSIRTVAEVRYDADADKLRLRFSRAFLRSDPKYMAWVLRVGSTDYAFGDGTISVETGSAYKVEWANVTTLWDINNVGDTVSVSLRDSGLPSLVFSESSIEVDEGDRATYTVKLSKQPTGSVTVDVASDEAAVATVLPAALTFTTVNWDVPQPVTVTGAQDPDGLHGKTAVSHTGASVANGKMDITVWDDEPPSLVLSKGGESLPPIIEIVDGLGETFGVTLSRQPLGEVTVEVDCCEEPVLGASPGTLTFTAINWNVPQAVTLTDTRADPYLDVEFTEFNLIPVSTADPAFDETNIAFEIVAVAFIPAPAVAVAFGAATYRVAEGGRVDVTVQLDVDGQRDGIVVPVTVQAGAGTTATLTDDYTLSADRVTFNSGETAKTVTVTAVRDDVSDANETVTLKLGPPTDPKSAATLGSPSETVVTITNFVPRPPRSPRAPIGLDLSDTELELFETGDPGTFTVTLDAAPRADVTVAVASADAALVTAAPAQLAFTPEDWDQPQTVTLSALADADDVDRETVTVTLTPSGAVGPFTPAVVTVTHRELPPVEVLLRAAVSRVLEGLTLAVTVSLSADPQRDVTVPVVARPGTAGPDDYALSATSVTFARGETAKTVIVSALTDDLEDEPDETVRLAVGADLPAKVTAGVRAETEVTIENRTRLAAGVQAWTARFGRTVGTHVTDAVGARLRGAPGHASHLTIGGYRVPLGRPAGTPPGRPERSSTSRLLRPSTGLRTGSERTEEQSVHPERRPLEAGVEGSVRRNAPEVEGGATSKGPGDGAEAERALAAKLWGPLATDAAAEPPGRLTTVLTEAARVLGMGPGAGEPARIPPGSTAPGRTRGWGRAARSISAGPSPCATCSWAVPSGST